MDHVIFNHSLAACSTFRQTSIMDKQVSHFTGVAIAGLLRDVNSGGRLLNIPGGKQEPCYTPRPMVLTYGGGGTCSARLETWGFRPTVLNTRTKCSLANTLFHNLSRAESGTVPPGWSQNKSFPKPRQY